MSPRPRTTSDQDLLLALHQVVSRQGPNLTLADVAREAGVSAATLVQRFGSKRGMLLAFASLAAEGTDEEFAAIREKHADVIDALREIVRCYARTLASSPEAVSNGLAFLQIDLSDPDFHRHALAQARATLAEFEKLLNDGVKSGRLVKCDTRKLAFALNAIIGGSMLSWAVLREGTSQHAMQQAVDALMAPYISGRSTSAASAARGRSGGRRG